MSAAAPRIILPVTHVLILSYASDALGQQYPAAYIRTPHPQRTAQRSVPKPRNPRPEPRNPKPEPQTPNPAPLTPHTKPQTPKTQPPTPNNKPLTPNTQLQTPNSKPQTPSPNQQTPNTNPQTPHLEPQIPYLKSQTSNTKPKTQTPNFRPQTPKPKPQTPNPTPETLIHKPEPRDQALCSDCACLVGDTLFSCPVNQIVPRLLTEPARLNTSMSPEPGVLDTKEMLWLVNRGVFFRSDHAN